jgi:hypothetical protein
MGPGRLGMQCAGFHNNIGSVREVLYTMQDCTTMLGSIIKASVGLDGVNAAHRLVLEFGQGRASMSN